MTKPRTSEQLASGAHAMSYRSFQLAHAVIANATLDRSSAGNLSEALTNALIDSVLVNARGLAWFFQNRTADVHVGAYSSDWEDQRLAAVLEPTVEATSMHLAHATWGAPDGEPHPGAWPLVELAVTYVEALSRFVGGLQPGRVSVWTPDPVAVWKELESTGAAVCRSPISANPRVKALTIALHRYLDGWQSGP